MTIFWGQNVNHLPSYLQNLDMVEIFGVKELFSEKAPEQLQDSRML